MSVHDDGYMLVDKVFSPEMMRLQETNMARGVEHHLVVGLFRNDPFITQLARIMLGPDLIDTGEANVNFNCDPAKLYADWHRDDQNIDGTVMPAWRFAVYFQDYTKHSGGLQVVPGSHLRNLGTDPPVVIQSAPGDVVMWNLRTLHAAGAKNNRLPVASPRNAVFFDYAAPDPSVDAYIAMRVAMREEQRKRGKV